MSTSPIPEDRSDGPSDDEALLASLEAIIGRTAAHETVMVPRWRRLVHTLHGLGLLRIVGDDWVRIGPGGLTFGVLSPDAADRLATLLEDLEFELAPVVPPGSIPDEPVFDIPPFSPVPHRAPATNHVGARP